MQGAYLRSQAIPEQLSMFGKMLSFEEDYNSRKV